MKKKRKKKTSELNRHRKEWTQREEKLLWKIYPDAFGAELEDRFGRTMIAIKERASLLGIRKNWRKYVPACNRKPWSQKELKQLQKLYSVMPIAQLLEHFPRRSRMSIIGRSRLLGLRKNYVRPSDRPNSSNLNLWPRQQKDLLIKLYPTTRGKDLAEKFGRTESAILGQAAKLGVHKPSYKPSAKKREPGIRWSDKEVKTLRHLWQQGYTKSGIAETMNKSRNSVHDQVRKQIQDSGLQKRFEKRPWSQEELAYLIEHYKNKSAPQISALFGRTLGSIRIKIHLLKLASQPLAKQPRWAAREINILKKYYQTLPNEKIAEKLNSRTPRSVVGQARRLGLKKNGRPPGWTQEQDRYLIRHYPAMASKEIAAVLGRTVGAVRHRAKRLKTPKSSRWAPAEVEKLTQLLRQGYSSSQIAQAIGRPLEGVKSQIRRLKHRLGPPKKPPSKPWSREE